MPLLRRFRKARQQGTETTLSLPKEQETETTQPPPKEPSRKRILVLGSSPHTRLVDAYAWDKLPRQINVADYDVVILNFVPFLDKELAQGIQLDNLPSLEQFIRLIFSEGSEIIAIGVPGIRIGPEPAQLRRIPLEGFWSIAWWLPLFPDHKHEAGEEIRNIEPEFAYYFQYVRRWFFFATPQLSKIIPTYTDSPYYYRIIHPQCRGINARLKPIAQTRFQQPIAYELQIQGLQVVQSEDYWHGPLGRHEMQPIMTSGRIIWLPPTTDISNYEAVSLILRERYGLGFEEVAPAWVEVYKLPHQLPLEAEIDRLEQEIQALTEQLGTERHHLLEASRFRKLLYEQGEALELVVRDALRELGAQVDDPKLRTHEDGRLIDPTGRQGMLEIKGRTGPLRLSDVRELDQWVRDGIANENWQSKGLLIANLGCGTPPLQRRDLFPLNCVRTGQQYGQCFITTTQLFRALCSHQRGELDLTAFWDTIFSTNGVCLLPELER